MYESFSQKSRQTATKVCSPTFMPDASCHALNGLILKNIKPLKIQINIENLGDSHPSLPPVVSLGYLLPLYFFTWLSITPSNWGLSVSLSLLLLSWFTIPNAMIMLLLANMNQQELERLIHFLSLYIYFYNL